MSNIKSIKQLISENDVVKYVDKFLLGLKEPSKNLNKYLENLENLSSASNDELEEYLGVFIAWQNYYHELMVRLDVVRSVAVQQCEYYYSIAVEVVEGSVNLRKDLAKSNSDYIKADEVRIKAESLYQTYKFKYEACERAFKLVSRILTKRLNLKYDV